MLPVHNAVHPVAENMKERKAEGLRAWRSNDPYGPKAWETTVDPKIFTTGEQDFYETILFEIDPRVIVMHYVNQEFIDQHTLHFDGVHQSFTTCGLDKLVSEVSMV